MNRSGGALLKEDMTLDDFKDGTYKEEPTTEERKWDCTASIQVDVDPLETKDFPAKITIADTEFSIGYMNANLGIELTVEAVTRGDALQQLEERTKEIKEEIQEETGMENSYMYIEGDDLWVEPKD